MPSKWTAVGLVEYFMNKNVNDQTSCLSIEETSLIDYADLSTSSQDKNSEFYSVTIVSRNADGGKKWNSEVFSWEKACHPQFAQLMLCCCAELLLGSADPILRWAPMDYYGLSMWKKMEKPDFNQFSMIRNWLKRHNVN